MTPTRAALLRDVAGAIISSGYAVMPQAKRPHIRRIDQISEIAHWRWIECDPNGGAYDALIGYVMQRYSASRWTARRMVRQARKMREENNGAKTQ